LETVRVSLNHSCATIISGQGISLPEDRYSYNRCLLEVQSAPY